MNCFMVLEYSFSYNLISFKKAYQVEYKEFKEILKSNNLTIKKFSELANISYNTCNAWSKRGIVSDWVEPFLTLHIENQRLKELKKDDDCEEYKALAKALQDVISKEK